MAAENGFLIDGKVYESPTVFSLSLDEDEVLYDRCGLMQEDFLRQPGESEDEHTERVTKMTRQPGFWAALMQIAYQRANPTAKPAQVKRVIGKTSRIEALSTLMPDEPDEEEPEVPLVLTSEPAESSENGSPENDNSTRNSTASSGSDSGTSSGGPAGELVSIGITRSATSSTSDPETSAVSGHPI